MHGNRLKHKATFQQLIAVGFLLLAGISHNQAAELPGPSRSWRSSLKKTAMLRPAPEYKVVTAGNVQTVVTNYGGYGDPEYANSGRPSMEYPTGSNNHYLYDGAIWIGAISSGDTCVSSYFYYFIEWEPSEGSSFLVGDEIFDPVSDMDSYVEFDDLAPKADHTPLGIRVIQRTYSWVRADYDDFLVLDYQIVNTGFLGDLSQVYVGWWFDVDVASLDMFDQHSDDLLGFDSTRQMSYMWDGDDYYTPWEDTGDPHHHQLTTPGYMGQRLIYSPTGGVASHQSWNWETDPENDAEQYAYMSSGEILALPDSIIDRKGNWHSPPVLDWRWLQSVGPFDLPAGDTLHLVTGLVMGNGLEGLQAHSDRMIEAYQNNWDVASLPNLPPLPPVAPVALYDGSQTCIYATENTETDLAGYNVYRSMGPEGPFTRLNAAPIDSFPYVDVSPPEPPMYYVVTAVDDQGLESGHSDTVALLTGPSVVHVPAGYPTIQAGIAAARNGDTVLVAPGIYEESINFDGKAITVGSRFLTTGDTSYIRQTVIDGDSAGALVVFGSGEGRESQLAGLTIRNGSRALSAPYFPGGIYCNMSSPILAHLIITENNQSGVVCLFNSNPIITGCTIRGNSAVDGGGISCYLSAPQITNTLITGNHAMLGGGMHLRGKAILTNVTIADNTSQFNCPAIYAGYDTVNIVNSIIWNNRSEGGEASPISGSVLITYSDVEGKYWGIGNIDAEPLFADTSRGDYRLQVGSPAIDSGNPSIIYNDQNGSRNDMGAHGGGRLSVNFDEYYFGEVGLNTPSVNERSVRWLLYNHRNTPFTILSASFDPDHQFHMVDTPFPLIVEPFSAGSIKVVFIPQSLGLHTGIMTIQSDDLYSGPSAQVTFRGRGVEQTTLSGSVAGVLKIEYSPFIVTGDIEVQRADSLIVEPGVQILFNDLYDLSVEGKLTACGTEPDSIIFTLHENASSDRWQGIIFNQADDQSTIEYCRIDSSYTGLELNATSPVIQHNTFSNNMVGIRCVNSHATIINNRIVENHDTGVSTNNSTSRILYNLFTKNGVAIYLGHSSPRIAENEIIYNYKGINIYRSSGNVISNNISRNNGDGIQGQFSAATVIENDIEDNLGNGVDLLFSDGRIERNSISNNGMMGLFARQSSTLLVGNSIFNNSGPGISCRRSSCSISNNVIDSNLGSGIVLTENSTDIVSFNSITSNTANDIGGGGIYCRDSSPSIVNNSIVNNISLTEYGGGGIFCYDSSPLIFGNVIARNCADLGSGIFCKTSSSPRILNNTIVNNIGISIFLSGSNFIFEQSSHPTIVNTIIWGHAESFGSVGVYNTTQIIHSAIHDSIPEFGTDGGGNIFLYPQFADSTTLDFHLLVGSPCIDAGLNDSVFFSADIDSNIRIYDGKGIGHPVVDMGAYEFGAPYLGVKAPESKPLPAQFALRQNYPNPFNPATTIRFDLPEAADAVLVIYDILGREIKTLVAGMQEPGHRSVVWDGTSDRGQPVSSGVYLYRIQAGEFTQARKMVLLR